MKKLLTMMALGILMTGGAYAQDTVKKEKKQRTEQRSGKGDRMQKMDPEERAKKQADMMGQKLGLSAAQKNELQALNMRRVAEMQALNEKYTKTDARNEAQRAERKAIRDKYHAEMKQVLNEEQYAQLKAERKEKRKGFGKSDKERMKGQKINKGKHQEQKSNKL